MFFIVDTNTFMILYCIAFKQIITAVKKGGDVNGQWPK